MSTVVEARTSRAGRSRRVRWPRWVAILGVASMGTVLIGAPSAAGVTASGSAPPAAAVTTVDAPAPDGNYVPLPQKTLVDTRSGTGLPKAKLSAATTVSFAAAGGTTGIPASGVDAVVLAVTTTGSTTATAVTAWTAGQPRPPITVVVGQPGENAGGDAYVKPGTNNQVSLFSTAGATDVIVYAIGYFRSTDGGGGFSPVPGKRAVDTTKGVGAPQAKIAAGRFVDVSLAAGGIPISATAAVVSVTTFSTVNNYINLGRPGQVAASSVSVAGDNYPSTATQIAQTSGPDMRVTVGPAADLDVIVDVVGYFDAPGSGGGFTPASGRVLDTRTTGTPVPAGGTTTVDVLGKSGIPPTGVGAVAVSLTVANPGAPGHARIYAEGGTEPQIQTITFDRADTTTGTTITSTGGINSGRLLIRNQSTIAVNYVVDVQGWFAPYYPTAPPAGSGSNYITLPQAVVADTRNGTGLPPAKLTSGNPLTVQVSGVAGVPRTGATAVAMTLMTSNSSGNGPVQLWPAGTARPIAITHTTAAGRALSNTTIATLGQDGKISLTVDGGVSTDATLWVTGFFTRDRSGGGYAAHKPTVSGDSIDPGLSRPFRVLDPGQPADGKARTQGDLNLVVIEVDAPSSGVLAVGPPGGPVTVLTYPGGLSSSTTTTAALDNRIDIVNNGTSAAKVTVIGQGWFGEAASDGGFHPTARRLYDSRPNGSGMVNPNLNVPILGQGGVPNSGVGAATIAVTVLNPTAVGRLGASTFGGWGASVNYVAGESRTVITTVALQDLAGGLADLRLFNDRATPYSSPPLPVDVVVDVIGWFDTYEQMDTRTDDDDDALPDEVEARAGLTPGSTDSDGDGLTDGQEVTAGADPTAADTNGNGVPDSSDDPDHDGVTTAVELADNTVAYRPDTDGDTLSDGHEKQLHTNPLAADTDGDGVSDGDEYAVGSDPLTKDSDGDGVGDAQEPHSKTIAPAGTRISFTATGPGGAVNAVQVRQPTDGRLTGVPGQLTSPVEVLALRPLSSGTLQIPFDTSGLAADAELAVLHFNETTGTFDRPANQNVDLTVGIATVTTNSFSPFVVVNLTEFKKIWSTELIQPRSSTGDKALLDVVLDLDSSGSMAQNDPSGARLAAAKSLVDVLGDHDRAAVVDFDDVATLLQPLTTDKVAVKGAIDRVDANGGTNIAAGLRSSLDHLDQVGQANSGRAVILLTDGDGVYDNSLITRAHDSHTTVYTVGLGSGVRAAQLQAIADQTGGKYYQVTQANQLNDVFDQIGDDVGYADTDQDGLADEAETAGWRDGAGRVYKTNPAKADTDSDGLTDGDEAGTYATGGTIGKGTYYNSYSDPTVADTDTDGVGDAQEYDLGTRARMRDSDTDGLDDYTEVDAGFDATALDADNDGRLDAQELDEGSDPIVYDESVGDSVAAVSAGFLFGDTWDSFAARHLGVTDQLASSPWYLVGTTISGIAIVGDIRDILYNTGSGAWGSAAIAAVGIIPWGGDTIKAAADALNFARKNSRAAHVAIRVAESKLPPDQVKTLIRQIAAFGQQLPQDGLVAGRFSAREPAYNVLEGRWLGGSKRLISKDAQQMQWIDDKLVELRSLDIPPGTVEDVRVNQVMVDALGSIRGINRPDLQYTYKGKRYYVELDRPLCKPDGTSLGRSRRGAAHELRIRTNDQTTGIDNVQQLLVGACQ